MNKALLEVGGVPIIQRILRAIGPLVQERVLIANDDSLSELHDVTLVLDPRPHAGVLPALAAGLAAVSGQTCLTVACDMPFASRGLFEYLTQLQVDTQADVVIPRTAGYLEPMHAVYRVAAVRRAIESALQRGEQRMIGYFRDVHVREVAEAEWRAIDPGGLAFFNVNTPDDLAEARRLAEENSFQAGHPPEGRPD